MNAGYSAGWCSVAFNLDLTATEMLCKAKGDLCCRFIMSHTSHVLQDVKKYQAAHIEEHVHLYDNLPGVSSLLFHYLTCLVYAQIVEPILRKYIL